MTRKNNGQSVFESRIISNIATLVIALVSVGAVYGSTSSKIQSLENRISSYEEEILPVLHSLNSEVWALRVEQAKIAQDIEWIKEKVVSGTQEGN